MSIFPNKAKVDWDQVDAKIENAAADVWDAIDAEALTQDPADPRLVRRDLTERKEMELKAGVDRLRQIEAEERQLEKMLADNRDQQSHQRQIIAAHEAMLNILQDDCVIEPRMRLATAEDVFDQPGKSLSARGVVAAMPFDVDRAAKETVAIK